MAYRSSDVKRALLRILQYSRGTCVQKDKSLNVRDKPVIASV